jgi:hypothetical protein
LLGNAYFLCHPRCRRPGFDYVDEGFHVGILRNVIFRVNDMLFVD